MQEITIENSYGDAFTVLPRTGATISNLIIDGEPVIKYPLFSSDPEKGYPSALLFPFPNRIRDGKYVFEGQTHQLDLNESRKHAIHGFVAFEAFEILEQKASGIILQYIYTGGVSGYDFPFQFQIKYSFPKKNTFRLAYRIENTGKTSMPCGFGWHPYFSMGDYKVGDLELTLPPHYRIETDDSVIPFQSNDSNGQQPVGVTTMSLKNTILDNVFEMASDDKTSSIILASPTHELEIKQQLGGNKLNYFVLYTPPVRNCIAIEPQTSNINSFNNHEGLMTLAAGQVAVGQVDIMLRVK